MNLIFIFLLRFFCICLFVVFVVFLLGMVFECINVVFFIFVEVVEIIFSSLNMIFVCGDEQILMVMIINSDEDDDLENVVVELVFLFGVSISGIFGDVLVMVIGFELDDDFELEEFIIIDVLLEVNCSLVVGVGQVEVMVSYDFVDVVMNNMLMVLLDDINLIVFDLNIINDIFDFIDYFYVGFEFMISIIVENFIDGVLLFFIYCVLDNSLVVINMV